MMSHQRTLVIPGRDHQEKRGGISEKHPYLALSHLPKFCIPHTMSATMKAVVCPKAPLSPSGDGAQIRPPPFLANLRLGLRYVTNHPCPKAQPGRVLIRIHAAGLNRSELFTRQGHSPSVKFPRVLGIEAVGEVVDNGGDDTWKSGDKVAAVMGDMGREFDGYTFPIRIY
jgi:hypothetical protein